jgi:hypothetical protein
VFAGQTFNPPDDLVKFTQADVTATDAADKARADWLATVRVQDDSHRNAGPVLRAVKRQVLAQFGDTQDTASVLADFGLTPQRTTTTTAATKADAMEMRKGTPRRAPRDGPEAEAEGEGNGRWGRSFSGGASGSACARGGRDRRHDAARQRTRAA